MLRPQVVGMSEYNTYSMATTLVASNILAPLQPGSRTKLHVASAYLTTSGNAVVVTFSRRQPHTAAAPSVDACKNLFAAPTAAALGLGTSNSNCVWDSDSVLVVTLGGGATIAVGDNISFAEPVAAYSNVYTQAWAVSTPLMPE